MQSLKMALRSIAANKLRAFLTMLGIIIGVMALVILVSLANGATGNVTDAIASLGSNLISVSVSDDKGSPLMQDELDAWAEEPAIGAVAAYASESMTAKYGAESSSVTVYGTDASYYDIQELSLLVGRYHGCGQPQLCLRHQRDGGDRADRLCGLRGRGAYPKRLPLHGGGRAKRRR